MQKCERCGRENEQHLNTCAYCGHELMVRCAQCQHSNPAAAQECIYCGAALQSRQRPNLEGFAHSAQKGLDSFITPSVEDQVHKVTAAVSGQRREVSVLYLETDFPFDSYSEQWEEQLFLLESEIAALFAAQVKQFSGHVDMNNGREAVALFGAPVMYENHAERAIQTAIELQNSLQARFDQFANQAGFQPAFAIGINTGHLLIGTTGGRTNAQYTIIGSTLKSARELTRRAEPSQILVSASTWQLTHPLYRFVETPLGDDEDQVVVAIYKLLQKRPEPGSVRGLKGAQSVMIGRRDRLQQLQRNFEDMLYSGNRHMSYLQAEAGIGKSRLVREFIDQLRKNQSQALLGICLAHSLAHTQTTPYYLISDLVYQLTGVDRLATPAVQQQQLYEFLDQLSPKASNLKTYLGYLLGFPLDQVLTEMEMHAFDAQMLQKLIHNAVRQFLWLLGRERPLLIILEDLHWSDPVSIACLRDLLNHPQEAMIFFLVTSRLPLPEALQHCRVPMQLVSLSELSPEEGRLLVHQLLAGSTDFERKVERLIAERGAGNPFFIEEIIRMLIDRQAIIIDGVQRRIAENALTLLEQVPGTLQALILSRFDRLDAFRQTVLRYASVLGDSFPCQLLQELLGESPGHVAEDLELLQSLQFLQLSAPELGRPCQFRHSLIRDAIYSTLLRRNRERLHDQVAQILIGYAEKDRGRPVQLIAYHLLHGKDKKRALPYLMEAAEESLFRSLNETAITYYQQIIDLVEKSGHTESELYLQARIGLGQAHKLIGQYDEANLILSAALQSLLGWSLRTKPLTLMQVMVKGFREIADIYLRQADYSSAISYLEAGIEALGTNSIDTFPSMYLSLMERIIFVRFRQGKLDEALDFGQLLLRHEENFDRQDLVALATVHNTMGGIYWQQGNYSAAVEYVEKGLEIFTTFNYPWGRANSLSNLGILEIQNGKWLQAETYLSEALRLRQEIGDLHNEAFTHLNLGQLRLSLGEVETAKQNLVDGLSILQQLNDSFGIAGARILMGQIALHQNEYAHAEKQALAAKKLADEIGGQGMQIEAGWILARAIGERGKLAEGKQILNEALQKAKAAGSVDAEADCLRVWGQLEVKSDHYLSAETKFRESIELSRQLNDPYRLALGLLEKGLLYRLNQKKRTDVGVELYNDCRLALKEAKELFDKLGAK
jgi:class 3 adenylate cyclase/tetratricopeptide (TPR) repeat protein